VTRPEVVLRAQRAQRIAQSITEGSRSPMTGLAGMLARRVVAEVLPEQVVPLLVAVHCGSAAASVGPVRAGDVELAKQLVDPALLGGTDDAIAATLTRAADQVPMDLPGFTRALASLTGHGDAAAGSVENDLRALTAESLGPWRDPALNIPVAQIPRSGGRFSRTYIAPARVRAQAIVLVLAAILAICLVGFGLSLLPH
jgi:hypothetical protein